MDMLSKILATAALAGFAIQQILEILNPVISVALKHYCNTRKATKLCLTEAELKKWVMAILAFALGIVTVRLTNISLLGFIEPDWQGELGDVLISGLVIGAGTEGLNTLTKYFGYVKEGRKAALINKKSLTIYPQTVSVKPGEKFVFHSSAEFFDEVNWQVAHINGGKINNKGLYHAPMTTGTYQVIASEKKEPNTYALATINVVS